MAREKANGNGTTGAGSRNETEQGRLQTLYQGYVTGCEGRGDPLPFDVWMKTQSARIWCPKCGRVNHGKYRVCPKCAAAARREDAAYESSLAPAGDRGLKGYETRSWSTIHRGPLAIHAAKETPRPIIREMGLDYFELVEQVRNARRTVESGSLRLIEMPTSAIVGVVGVEGCEPVEAVGEWLTDHELKWGDYSHGRSAWKLIHPIGPKRGFVPLVCSGKQKLWEMPAEVSRLVELQLHLCAK